MLCDELLHVEKFFAVHTDMHEPEERGERGSRTRGGAGGGRRHAGAVERGGGGVAHAGGEAIRQFVAGIERLHEQVWVKIWGLGFGVQGVSPA